MWGHLSPCHKFPREIELDWWCLRDLSVWSSASPRAYLGLLSFLICKSEGSVLIWKDSALKGFFHLLWLQLCCWESNLMLGQRWSAQVPWELGSGTRGLGAILSVLTACRPVFFHPPPGCSVFIHSAIQPIFTNIYVMHACLLSSLRTGHQEAQMAGLT